MKAIFTKYHGPTNFKGSRISASDMDGNKVTISYPHELSGEDVHRAAADALCAKMNWTGNLIGGGVRNGYVFVFAPPTQTELADAVLLWAKTPGSHGGNPYTLPFVQIAEAIKESK